ncbi:HET-domain-containing protein [Hyaloscypha variabilis F]|uniref:HET-domain-containing protein n=1 Tax=Hyaloscypha variabilis (strain UAMH 11265 / GT02V1 / F) TaxID=1149755 RepID=A0A2J6S8V9_HYAVF|nr:HET-domain-containing protein [Hyaloscypha variabilis F]
MTYFWRVFKDVLILKSLPFGIDSWLFPLPKGWKFSISIWAKFTIDDPLPSPLDPAIRTNPAYTPLAAEKKQIRLIDLSPGDYHKDLEATLVTYSLGDWPYYEALSYTWGSLEADRKIILNGRDFAIGKSLEDALRTLRRHDSPRRIWIDAICINQDNIPERNHQVQMMGQIYGQAENVAVFLGLASEHSKIGMSILGFLVDISNPLEDRPWLKIMDEAVELGIQDIFHREWFWRIWTIQEAALAKKITLTCGSQTISWTSDVDTLRRILFRIKSVALSPEWQSTQATRLNNLDWSPLLNILEMQLRTVALKEHITIEKNLLDIAFDFRHRRCVDPRDKYFAIFGLADKSEGRQLFGLPDYRLSLEEVHNRFMTEIASLHGIFETPPRRKNGGYWTFAP